MIDRSQHISKLVYKAAELKWMMEEELFYILTV